MSTHTQVNRRKRLSEFMTVGELARLAGVTVRTVQFYDQKGLLRPSAKGAHGQRLYTQDDAEQLFRIMTLKYLGLSLADISSMPEEIHPMMFRALVSKSLSRLEDEFKTLFVRMNTLRSLEESAEKGYSWQDLASVVDRAQGEDSFQWSMLFVRDDQEASEGVSKSMIDSWHAIIDKTIELMRADVAPNSPEAHSLAREFLAAQGQGMPDEQEFAIIQSSMPASHRQGDFGKMVAQVFDYLRCASRELEGSADAER